MARLSEKDHSETTREAFNKLTLEDLGPLAALVQTNPPKKKTELVPLLAKVMSNGSRVRELYGQLDETSQNAVRVAAFDPRGWLDEKKFRAWFGSGVKFSTTEGKRNLTYAEQRASKPTLLRLFFPRFEALPTDLRAMLRELVPPPEPFATPSRETLPETHTLHDHIFYDKGQKRREWTETIRVRETAPEAEADLRSVLRLIDASKVRVTDKKRVPTEASREAIGSVLTAGDFYTSEDADEWKDDAAYDLGIKSFAWPVLVQVGRLAEKHGDSLKMTSAGRAALSAPPAETLRKLWTDWVKSREFDEFARIEVIKGQGRASMSAVASRRNVMVQGLNACPVDRWVSIDDFFRLLRATGLSFTVSHDPFDLYIAEHGYGSLGHDDENTWEQLQGRFVLAFLFETAGTLGLLDLGYIPPQEVRHDYQSRWGADNLSCLSRYDGLLYFRINPLGAWLLGKAGSYEPAASTRREMFRVLANRDVVATGRVPHADRLVLERFADQESEGVWKLSSERIISAIEAGGTLDELSQFLESKILGDLPSTVTTFLSDLRSRAERVKDAGPARLIECADAHVAAELAADRHLKGKCLQAGERFLAVKESDLNHARKAFRRLGYIWPLPS